MADGICSTCKRETSYQMTTWCEHCEPQREPGYVEFRECLRVTKQRDALLKAAKAAEWGDEGGPCYAGCPVCGNERRLGHAPDCILYAAIAACE